MATGKDPQVRVPGKGPAPVPVPVPGTGDLPVLPGPHSPSHDAASRLRAAYEQDRRPSVGTRRRWLNAIDAALRDRREEFFAAERADLNKPEVETLMTEIRLCRDEARFMARRVGRWMRPRRVRASLLTFPSRQRIVPEPRGVVLVIGTWNYPIRLTVGPVLAALAAGNRVVLKPSERAPATSSALKALFAAAVGDDVVTVAEGGRETAESLLAEPFDMIFYTGGEAGGRAVMQAATRRLTPVVLELGGKSPCIVHESANVAAAARRIAWGKFLNAGQTCLAPDFVCVHASVYDAFVRELEAAVRRSFPSHDVLARDSARVVGAAEFDRLEALVTPGAIRVGAPDRERLVVPPTLIPGAGWDHPAMQHEIFGPVLPILRYDDRAALVRTLESRPTPLAVYVFAEDRRAIEWFAAATTSGAFVANDTIRHLANFRLPFGGRGASGFGRYAGYFGFETFSHMRPEVVRATWFTAFDLAPPYGKLAKRLLRWM